MKVLVTGASGFVGSCVVRRLLERGHSIMILAVPADPLWRLQEVRNRFSVADAHMGQVEVLRRRFREFRPEACIHLAWYAEPGQYLHATENVVCLAETVALLGELIDSGCRRIVMAGTCAEYDTDYGYLREDTPTKPTTLYAAAKTSCYLVSRQIAARAQVDLAWGRIFSPYGPREDTRRIVPAAICSLLQGRPFPATDGGQIRDYVHVEDVATAFCLLAETTAEGAFNIASGEPVTIRHLLETIGILTGRGDLLQFGRVPHRDWDPPFICGDSRRLRQIGWRPRYTLHAGLAHTVDWWQSGDGKDTLAP
jgi:UDP-glucuronate decarboxylase